MKAPYRTILQRPKIKPVYRAGRYHVCISIKHIIGVDGIYQKQKCAK
tara:strand:+ start:937 stop:1077 length:141 start_codon:yes stop_codon:yes gene_type:complete